MRMQKRQRRKSKPRLINLGPIERLNFQPSTPSPQCLRVGSWRVPSVVAPAMLAASSRLVVIGITGVVLLMAPAPLRAQGNGRFTPPGLAKKAATTSPNVLTKPNETLPGSGRRVQTFGSWIDTANVNAPGEAWMWVSTSYWRSPSLREIDAPAMGLSVGIAPRAQVGVSLPYYFLTDRSGFTSHGFGASYVMTKFAAVQNHRVNISASPTLEILSWTARGIRRVNLVLPLSAQTYAGVLRMYGSTGYFSRGSVFGTGAVEWRVRNHLTFTTSFARQLFRRIRSDERHVGHLAPPDRCKRRRVCGRRRCAGVFRECRPNAVAYYSDERPVVVDRRTHDQRLRASGEYAARAISSKQRVPRIFAIRARQLCDIIRDVFL